MAHKTNKESKGINRKQFLGYSVAGMTGAIIPGTGVFNKGEQQASFDKNGYKNMVHKAIQYKKIDFINHLQHYKEFPDLIKSCDIMGIKWAAVSKIPPLPRTPENVRQANDIILKGMKKYPNHILGSCFIDPGNTKEALAEIDRCVKNGFVMLGELYDAYKISDPVYYHIIEKCIELKIPIVMHGADTLGLRRQGYTSHSPQTTSTAEDFVAVGKRYPEAMIIHAHLGGGGDWDYTIKVLREAPSIYAGLVGSVYDRRLADFAVKELGVDRLLFGTDTTYGPALGRIMCANLTKKQREKIFFDNFNNLLKKAGNNVS
jgi:predicted TIM-barrel fold metal-dependent hydrolase